MSDIDLFPVLGWKVSGTSEAEINQAWEKWHTQSYVLIWPISHWSGEIVFDLKLHESVTLSTRHPDLGIGIHIRRRNEDWLLWISSVQHGYIVPFQLEYVFWSNVKLFVIFCPFLSEEIFSGGKGPFSGTLVVGVVKPSPYTATVSGSPVIPENFNILHEHI